MSPGNAISDTCLGALGTKVSHNISNPISIAIMEEVHTCDMKLPFVSYCIYWGGARCGEVM